MNVTAAEVTSVEVTAVVEFLDSTRIVWEQHLGLLVLGCETVSHDMGSMGANLSRVGNRIKRGIQHKGHGSGGAAGPWP